MAEAAAQSEARPRKGARRPDNCEDGEHEKGDDSSLLPPSPLRLDPELSLIAEVSRTSHTARKALCSIVQRPPASRTELRRRRENQSGCGLSPFFFGGKNQRGAILFALRSRRLALSCRSPFHARRAPSPPHCIAGRYSVSQQSVTRQSVRLWTGKRGEEKETHRSPSFGHWSPLALSRLCNLPKPHERAVQGNAKTRSSTAPLCKRLSQRKRRRTLHLRLRLTFPLLSHTHTCSRPLSPFPHI